MLVQQQLLMSFPYLIAYHHTQSAQPGFQSHPPCHTLNPSSLSLWHPLHSEPGRLIHLYEKRFGEVILIKFSLLNQKYKKESLYLN